MSAGDYVDETHQRIAEFAEEFLDDDEERGAFIDGLLERRGYQRSQHWAPPEPQQGGGRQPLLRQGGGGQGGGRGGASRSSQAQRSYFKPK